MIVSMVFITDENGVIANKGDVPWKIKRDMRRFKEVTIGKPVIMGRRTYDAMGKALENRYNIVMSHRPNLELPDAVVAHSFEEALELARATGAKEASVIGGGDVYKAALPFVDIFYLTIVHGHFEGEVKIEVDLSEWEVMHREDFEPDENFEYSYTFLDLRRPVG